ncbi:MAG: twin-arginine translocation signal domain-containing protein, partial [Pyrinomonadaceae bacterium]
MSNSRRNFLKKSGLVGAGLLASTNIASAQHEGHVPTQPQPKAQPKKDMGQVSGGENVLVQTPDVPKLPWTLEGGVK